MIYVLAFIAVVLLAQTVAGILLRNRDRTRRVNQRLTMMAKGMEQEDVYANLVRGAAGFALNDRRLINLYARAESYCRQAGLSMTPARLAVITAAAAGVLWVGSMAAFSLRGGSLLANSFLSLIGSCVLSVLVVYLWVSTRRNRRQKQFDDQLPVGLDIVVRAVRAGHPVIAAVKLAAQELGDPVGSELGIVVDETTYGAELKEALVNFARRTGSADAHYLAVAISIQSETGGNLAEILEGLSKVMRGRGSLGKKVKALASEGKASAYLLSALPIFVVGTIMSLNPKMYTSKFDDPAFWPIVAGVLIQYGLGLLMIRRILNFRY
jgi:tight adherence protein B